MRCSQEAGELVGQWLTQQNPSKCGTVLLSLAKEAEESLMLMITWIVLVARVQKMASSP